MALVAPPPTTPRMHHPDEGGAPQNQAFYEFLVPLVKGLSTEMSLDVASLGVQVHGGMGFIEETGAAQYLRDAKILTIYEGTTAIQANDLVGRKTARDGGQVARGHRRADRGHRSRTGPQQRGRPWRWPALAPRARPSWTWWTSSPARPRPAQRGVRRQRALPDAGRHPGGRLADGACADGRRRPAGRRRGPTSCGQDRHRALLRRPHPQQGAGLRDSIVEGADSVTALAWRPSDDGPPVPAVQRLPLPIIGSPLFIISNPKLVIAQCTGRRGGQHAGAQCAPGRAARRVAGRDHRDPGRLGPAHPDRRPRPLPSTRSCTRATTGSSTTCRSAPSTRCRSSSPRWARAPTSTRPCMPGAAWCCTTSSTTPSRTRRSRRAPTA
jgi:hypothetical protein